LYAQESFGVDLQETVYALDTTDDRNFGKRGQVTNLDRRLRLRLSRHRQEAPAALASLYEILQILSLTMFEKIPLDQLLAQTISEQIQPVSRNQLILFA